MRTTTMPSMQVRRTTFPFDLLALYFDGFSVRLFPVEGKTPEQRAKEYFDDLYGCLSDEPYVYPAYQIFRVVERHGCEYVRCLFCDTELLAGTAVGKVYCSEYCRDILRQQDTESAWGIPTSGDFGQPGAKEEHST